MSYLQEAKKLFDETVAVFNKHISMLSAENRSLRRQLEEQKMNMEVSSQEKVDNINKISYSHNGVPAEL